MELVKRGFGSNKITQDDLTIGASDIFSIPSYLDNFTEWDDICFSADGLSDENGPYKFTISSNDTQYISLNNIICVMKLALVNENDEAIHETDDQAFFLPNIASSIFETIKFDINGRPVADLTQDEYGYKSYIEHLLSYSDKSLGDVLSSRLMLPDPPGLWSIPAGPRGFSYSRKGLYQLAADKVKAATPAVKVPPDTGVVVIPARAAITTETVDERNKYMKGSIWDRWTYATLAPDHSGFRVATPLSIDWFGADRLLPPNTSLNIIFRKKPKEFYLLIPPDRPKGNDVKLKIVDFKLKVAYQTLAPQLRQEHEEKFNKGLSAIIPYQQIAIKRRAFPAGLSDLSFDYCITGDIPKQMLILMINSKAYDGDFALSPFAFHHYDMESCSLRVNNRMVPNEPIKCDFGQFDYAEQYLYFHKNIGLDALESSSMVSYTAYLTDYTMMAFDLTPDKCNGHHLHRLKNGTVDVKVVLKKRLTEPITMLVLCTYDKMLKLNKTREAVVTNI